MVEKRKRRLKNRMLSGKWSLWFGGIRLAVLICECDGG